MVAISRWNHGPCLAVLAAGVLFFQTASGADEAGRAKTLERLREFVKTQEAFRDSPAADRQPWLACDRLSRRTRDHELPEVEAFAMTPEGKGVRWLLVFILIQRDRFDAAANVLTCEMTEAPDDREYRVGKWWWHHFNERPDYEEMSWKLADSFVRRFERANEAERLAIAETFGKGRPEAGLSAGEFRKAIGLPERPPARPATRPTTRQSRDE